MLRKKWTEAKSLGWYVITGISFILLVGGIVVYFIFNRALKIDSGILSAIIGAAGALIGFHITIFALYFSFGMKEELKNTLKEYGFYKQIPRDILRTIILYGISITLAIASYFFAKNEVFQIYDLLTIASVIYFLCSICLTIYITIRFFKILFSNH